MNYKNIMTTLICCLMIICATFAQKKSVPYLDQNGNECALVWDINTGNSILYYYSSGDDAFMKSYYQLPQSPIESTGKIEMNPYLDYNGNECVLVWDVSTGKSILYYYYSSDEAFVKSFYQLPQAPIETTGDIDMNPYLDQNGSECVLIVNEQTGDNVLYYYSSSDEQFLKSGYQLPKF